MSRLSANLAHRILDGQLPWDRSVELHIDAFLEKYTLHDSYWIGLFADCAYEDVAIAAINFDPVWNSSVGTPTSVCADWPFLLLRFKCVSAIHLSRLRDIGPIQRGIYSHLTRRIVMKVFAIGSFAKPMKPRTFSFSPSCSTVIEHL